MKARDAVGKRIVRIEQRRMTGNAGVFYDVSFIELEDGTRLYPRAEELEGGAEYGISIDSSKDRERTRSAQKPQQTYAQIRDMALRAQGARPMNELPPLKPDQEVEYPMSQDGVSYTWAHGVLEWNGHLWSIRTDRFGRITLNAHSDYLRLPEDV